MTTEQRTNLKFLVRLGKSPSKALYMLQQVYQEQTLSCLTVFISHKRFKDGREDVEDDPRGGRPSTSRNETSTSRNDVRARVNCEFLPQGQIVNQHVYKEILQRLLRSVREKKRDLWESNTWLLHHDNAPAHTALSMRKFLADKNITVLEQPLIRQILLQVTFSFSPMLKTSSKEHIFQSRMP